MDYKWVIAITGGGTGAINQLLCHGGGSSLLLEAIVPYSKESLIDFIGQEPEKFASAHTARMMASASYMRGLELGEEVRAIGVTATMGYEDQREGRLNCANICVIAKGKLIEKGITLRGTREEQEIILSGIIVSMINKHSTDCQGCGPNENEGIRILSGSFNPVHDAHRHMMEEAKGTHYELCVDNADKGIITKSEVMKRLWNFHTNERVLLTTSSTFLQKEADYCNPTFIVGSDTYERVFKRDGQKPVSKFLIFQRDIGIDPDAPDNCEYVGESLPVSSTMLRKAIALQERIIKADIGLDKHDLCYWGTTTTKRKGIDVEVVIVGNTKFYCDFSWDLYDQEYDYKDGYPKNSKQFFEEHFNKELERNNKWKEYICGTLG